MSHRSFESTFTLLKQRVLVLASTAGLAWGWCGGIALLLVGMWLDLVWELSEVGRLCTVAGALITGAALLVSCIVFALRQTRGALLARRLDQTAQTGGLILAGMELDAAYDSHPAEASLTQGLAELTIQRASQLAEQVPEARVFPSVPAKRALGAAAALCFAVLLVVCCAPRLAAVELLRFSDPFGDHPPFSYTQLKVEPGNTDVRYGNPLDVVVVTQGPPVEELELVVRTVGDKGQPHEEALPMFPEVAGQWRATIASVTTGGQYFVRSKTTRSHRYQLGVITVPELEEVRFRVTPPAYTRDPVYEGLLPQGGLSVLAGTRVEVRARSNRPLQSGTLQLPHGKQQQTVALKPASADGATTEVSGTFTVSQAGKFQITVKDQAGQDCREPFTGTINLLKDQVPFIRLLEPAAQSLATPSIPLPVVLAAEDDYGVTKVQLYRSLNDSRAMPLTVPTADPALRRHDEETALPLAQYGLQPGDVIKLFARVEDNDPAGAKGSESPIAVIQIVSDEELQKMLRAREGVDLMVSKYQEAQRRMEALQDELEKLEKQLQQRDPDGKLTDDEKEDVEQLAKKIEEEAAAVRESAEQMSSYDLDKALNKELETLAKQMDKAAQSAHAAAKKPMAKAGETLEELKKMKEQLAQEKDKLQKEVNDPLEKLAAIYPLMEDQSRFEALAQRQRELAERLASMKGQDNPADPAQRARMRDLEEEQRQTREELENLLNEIESHIAGLPLDEPKVQQLADSAREFVDAVRASGADQTMSDAEAGLSEFSGSRGADESRKAADILEKFLSKCKGMGDGSGEACQGLKFAPGEGSLGDTLNQLLADAGFKPGRKPGTGTGASGGYSARRSALNNIGMYGQMPTRGNPTQASARKGKKSQQGTIGGSYRDDRDNVAPSRLDPHGLLKAAGTSEAAIPARYRNRVEQYFRRIAEEGTGQKP